MYEQNSSFEQRFGPFGRKLRIDPNRQIQKLEEAAREGNLIFRKDIQLLLKSAYSTTDSAIRESVICRLQIAIDAYRVEKIRAPDAFKPYGPEYLLKQGNAHLMTQMDGVRWLIPVDSLLTGAILVGPQQAGKSRCIVNLCLEVKKANPSIVITIIDPKGSYRYYSRLLSARYVDLGKTSFSLKGPDNIKESDFILEFIPPLCDTAGLIYSVEVVSEATLIALKQLESWRQATGQEGELSLKDIYVALSLVEDTSSGRRRDYRQAAQTVLRRILGEKGLFACRRGLSIQRLFSTNTVLNARSLTDDMQCRALALFFLYWEFQRCRYQPESNRLSHLLVFDDASRWFGTPGNQFGATSRTSPLAHILALLRATGTGVVVSTQLPGYLDPSLPALSRTMLAIGPTSGSQHLKVISDFMCLDDKEKIQAITRLSTREVVGFAPGTAVKSCIHGWVPFVADPPLLTTGEQTEGTEDFDTEPWHNLADVLAPAIRFTAEEAESRPPATIASAAEQSHVHPAFKVLSANAQRVVYDCTYYAFSAVSARVKRLGMSGRAFEEAQREATAQGFVIRSSAGQTVYLIATEKAFELFGIPFPYKRAVTLEHAFYVALGAFLLEKDPRYKSVRTEVPLGKTGAASDIVTIAHDGRMDAWEICLNTSRLLANANKYLNTAHAKVVFLARNHELRQAIKSFFKASNLDPNLLARLDYMHLSQLLRRQRKLSLY